jgi:hypothetical protein
MSYHGDWHEDALAALWSRQKTDRLVRAGLLESHGTDALGRQLFDDRAVMAHYQFKSPEAPGRACCTCCGHCAEPAYESAGALATTKAFGGPGYGLAEDEPGAGAYPYAYLADDGGGEDGEDSSQEVAGGLDDDLLEDDLEEDGLEDGEPMDSYVDRRLAALAAEQKALAALEQQAGLWALGQASLGLAAGRLVLGAAVGRWLGGRG